MNRLFTLFFLGFIQISLFSQSNILITDAKILDILKGNYDPELYMPIDPITEPTIIFPDIIDSVSPDSVKNYLEILGAFENRSTGSDTLSSTFGIGAARRWAFSKFESWQEQRENRLLPAYLQFDQTICGVDQHRNIMAVLPGVGQDKHEVIILEGHIDSRCEDRCDPNCLANGIDDNGSGSALVLELARVMSQYTFNRTIVFLLTIGEEQGLLGANAFAQLCRDESIFVKAVYNNDIVGGIICGATASPPGCPFLNHIDSINVRIYSQGSTNSKNKALARYVKLEYEDNIAPLVDVFTEINLMTPEDREGRGGDHIPFRERGYPAIRFTSANEHGDGNPSQFSYHDRQHTVDDILGVDTDNDNEIDSFFVDFNYLVRNAIINANSIASTSMSPPPPDGIDVSEIDEGILVEIDDPNQFDAYRIGVRSFGENDFDTVYTADSPTFVLGGLPSEIYFISAATIDSNGIESFFTQESFISFTTDIEDILPTQGVELLQNRPNPFDEATTLGVKVFQSINYQQAAIIIHDLKGKQLANLPISLTPGIVEVQYQYHNHNFIPGIYAYSLVIDGKTIETKRMVYAY